MREIRPIPRESGTHRFRFRWNFLHFLALFSFAILPASAQTINLLVNGQSNLNNTFYLPNGSTAQVSLASSIPGPLIYFTTNGADVDVTAPLFTGSFTTTNTIEVQAFATDASFDQSTPVLTGFINFVTADTVTDLTPGGGTVSLSPPGGVYASNSVVMLTANPASGWTFSHWSGGVGGTNPVLPVTLSNNLSFAAVFVTPVALAAVPANYGSIVANPPGGIYAYGTTIELSAVPGSASYFFRWANTALGTTSPTSLTVTNANPVGSALFAAIPAANFSLTLIANGPGTIGASPSAAYYASNAPVTITATPNSGYAFAGWSGGVTSSQNPLAVTMTNAQSITATFVVEHPQIIVQPSNAIAFAGNPFALSVQAQGAPTLYYQWYCNQTNLLSGDTNATLSFANLSTNQAGNYTVIVTNTYGSVTSMPALVQVASSTASVVGVGGSATFSITPLETPPFSLQWFFDATNLLTGATNAALTVGNITPAQAGSYTLVISNVAGSITSAPVGLTVSVPLSVITVAGLPGVVGFSDGSGQNARFNGPQGVAVDGMGNVYIADQVNNAVRLMTPGGAVTTLAGSGTAGPANGVGPQAQFSGPEGVAVDTNGNVYVADTGNKMIRQIAPGQVVSTLASLSPYIPLGVAADGSGNVYVTVYYNNGNNNYYVFEVSPSGRYSSLAGGTQGYVDGPAPLAQFSFGNQPCGIAVDSQGNLYVGDANNRLVRKLTNTGTNWQVSTAGSVPGGGSPMGVAVDGLGNVYAGSGNSGSAYTILEIYPNGAEATVAGLTGNNGSADGIGGAARFYYPAQMAVDTAGNLYIADYYNATIRKGVQGPVIVAQPQSQTVGAGTNVTFSVTATGSVPLTYQWQFNGANITGATNAVLSLGAADNADVGSYDVVVGLAQRNDVGNAITQSSALATLNVTYANGQPLSPRVVAGPQSGLVGYGGSYELSVGVTGTQPFGFQWEFDGAAITGATNFDYTVGNALPAESGSYSVVISNAAGSITSAPVGLTVSVPLSVITVAGLPGQASFSDGSGQNARFSGPQGVAVDGVGNVYIADQNNNAIRLMTPGGAVTTLAGSGVPGPANGVGPQAQFSGPEGVAVDTNGNVYVADTGNKMIRKIAPGQVVSTLANLAPYTPLGVAADGSGNVYVTTYYAGLGYYYVFEVSPNGGYGSLAGGQSGYVDGPAPLAQFSFGNQPCGIAVDSQGNLYVGDANNRLVRKLTNTGTNWQVSTVGSVPGGGSPMGVAVDGLGNVYTGSGAGAYTILEIYPNGAEATVAGLTGNNGSADGIGGAARFYYPAQMAVDSAGNLYIADYNNATIRKGVQGPVIVAQPQSQTVGAGTNVTFSVTATGSVPLTYQWQYNGANLTGATNAVLSLGAANNADVGSYDVVVGLAQRNDVGNAITQSSALATLNVTYANGQPLSPRVVARPQSGLVGYEGSYELSVGVTGTGPFGFQWEFDGAAITGATNFDYTVGNALPAESGSYSVVISNAAGSITSAPVGLTVSVPLSVITVAGLPGQASFSDGSGQNARFSGPQGVAVDGVGNVYIADQNNNAIRLMTPGGAVTTLAGSGVPGPANGVGPQAQFSGPEGVAVDTNGNVYVADTGNKMIRKIAPGQVVSTLANLAPYTPLGVAADGSGNVYVTTYYAGLGYYYVFEVSPNGGYGSLAGGQSGYVDGPAPLAQFSFGNQPCGIAVDSQGNLYVGDANNRLVRKLTNTGTNWQVSTVGSVPGGGSPMGVAVDGLGNVYAGSGTGAYTILEIYPNGAEATVAGLTGNNGSTDGIGSAARFYYPAQMAVDSAGNLYIADYNNATIRKGLYGPVIVAQPQSQTVGAGTNVAFSVTATGSVPLTYQWQFNGANITGATNAVLSFGAADNADVGSYDVVVGLAQRNDVGNAITQSSALATLNVTYAGGQPLSPRVVAGPQSGLVGYEGSYELSVGVTGTGPFGFQWEFDGAAITGATNFDYTVGNALPAESGSYSVVISNAAGSITSAPVGLTVSVPLSVITVAGLPGQASFSDGSGQNARFSGPQGVAVDGVGNVYIADQNNNAIRLMTPGGAVTTLAGSGVPGPANGVGPQAQFSGPEGVAVDTNGNVYVADTGNKMIRKIAPGQVVSTLANLAPYTPLGVAADGSGNVYVTTYYAGLGYYYVFEVSPNGGYGSLAGGQSGYVDGPAPLAQFSFGNQPCGIAVDSQGNLYVGDANNRLVRKLTNTGTNWQVSTVGSVPGGGSPMGVAVDGLGNVYTGSGAGAYTILEIYPNGAEATVAGLTGNNGSADGIGGAARFYYPAQMAVDTAGNLYIADVNNATIRKAGFIPFVTTLPQSQTALQGANLSLSAPVSGTLPITRQWQTNGVNIPNATNSTLVVSNIPYTAAGTYDLILSNAYGATTSIVDTVTVLAPLVITTPPQDTVALVDGSAAFNVVAIGNGTLACQWFFDGGLVSGATNTTLLLTNLTAAQAGTYTIVITNNIASITSAPAVLTIAANGTAVTGSGLDGTWTVAHSPYVVGANVSIDNVSIQPGVNVLFTGPYSFTVTGVLQATGTSNNPVTFAGSSPTVNWQGLRFVSANTNSAMSWCVITGATNGGLRFTNTPFALSNCLVASNSGPSGGGIYTDSPLWLQNCQILSNSATYTQNGANYFVQGGGLFSLTGGVTLQSCLISNNAAIMPNIGAASETSTGGGLDCEAGTLTLNNCVVVSNTAAGAGTSATELGGGIYINNSTAALSATASTFTGNAARGGFGGGVSAGTAALTVCVLSGNAATFGGGLYLGGTGNTDATNCLMSSNTAAQGGAVYSSAATAVGDFENCTVVNNSPDAFNGFTGLLHDSILYSNGTEIVLGLAASPVVNYCDVQGGYFGPGSNNITVLPQFANSPNFTLADDSPLIDAGDPTPQFNDQSFPPSQGGDQNDLGAYGGPGAALWPQFAASLPVVLLNGQPAAPLQVMTLPISSALTISLTNGFPGGSFGYSLDGSDPAGYFNYSGPFLLTSSAVLRAVAYDAQFENYAISAPVYVNLSGSIPITATTAGGGTVSPASATVLNNTVVTFTATPSNGWQFLYWTNGISGLSNIISVNVTAPLTNVQAVFGTTLTVSHLPATSGTVQTNPSLAYYPYGTAVQLTALPTGSHYFTNWLVVGAATNFVSPLDLIVTNPTPAVVAVFGNEPAGFYTVNVSVAGGGDIARTPQQPLYPANSVVSLSATAAPGYIFSAWTGSATGAANPLNVTVTSNLFVTANFVSTNGPPPGPPLVAITNPVNATQFTLPASVTVNAGAQDTNNRGSISQLAFFAGSNQLAVLTNQPFIYVWTNPVVGTDLLTAVALNNFGLTATSTPVSITVSLPPPGQPVFSLSASQYQVLENAGAVTLTVTKSLNSQAGAVNFSTQDGSAVSTGSVINYQAASGSLAFNASDTSKTVSIPIVDNSIYEGNTSFGFFLSASGQGSTVVSPSSATVTIIDVNQPAPGNSFLLQVFPQPAPSATGQLAVYMTPSQAGGQWRFPWDLAWRTNGQVVSGLPPDNYPIQFQEEPGYLPYPPTLSVGVTNGGTTPITNQYLPAPAFSGSGTGSLTVNIGPNAPPGSGWQIYGITGSYAPGATAANLLPDNYFILFNAVGGWSAPAELAVPVAAGLSETVTVNYQLAATPPAQAVLPGAVPPSDIGDLRDFPFGYAGELQSDVGYGSGVVVRQNVVLTAAHLVFNDESLAYVSQAYWSFEQEGGKFGPDPLAARGWYVLSGYASQRMNDLGSGYAPDQSSPQSQNLDVAALYFLTPAGRGGYGGYLASDTVPNQWLTSLQLKMLVGYPVDGPVFGQTVQPGSMYYTSPISSLFTQQTNQVYVTGSLLSYPGNSGGPVYVQFTNGTYYPAAVYLGTIGTGQGSQTVVRAINNDVVNLITLAAAFGDSGTNNSGGGVITIIPNLNVSRNNPGYLILQLGPPSAVQAGAAWELAGQPANYYSTANPSLQEITSTNALALQFRSIPGWNLPTNRSVTVFPGVIVTNVAIYTVTNPALTVDLAHGLGISGTSNTSYQIQSNSTLTGTWIPFQTNILTNFGFFTITNHPRPGFYRALWLTNSP